MDVFGAILNIIFFLLVIYLISRVFHHFNDTKNRLHEIDKKLEEINEKISNRD
ncbi:hypothetical protein JCM9157_4762 [Halalkalibacter akibai JCM 9157]|uniref:DUF4083 domain-containing protein n=1 Tax=Halalkalibacter akibai (strain ATCC 43226 / DSM 21942 / CIP 109018 / JCM 9157 / 1139) TaxID=1236973 RepID=W4QZH0_HALA3|nr:hypothetical protein JCM9157_4762 [Halalkalibacter akibai JCM 9157]